MNSVQSAQPIDPGPAVAPTVPTENCPPLALNPSPPLADLQCGLNPPSFPRSPAQVRFTPDGNRLVVTVKGTNTIYVFPVGENGKAGNPTTTQASLPILPSPFGLTFDKEGHLLVTELFGSATSIAAGGAGAVSSYTIARDGNLIPISLSSHVNDGGTAACWIALEPITGHYAYVANNLSNTISSYLVGADSVPGKVKLLNPVAASGPGPNDLAVASEAGTSFLYAVVAGNAGAMPAVPARVAAFRIDTTTGSLTEIAGGTPGDLPNTSAQGLAAF
jgi:DNA-binding beta-propeller fold protein YncE